MAENNELRESLAELAHIIDSFGNASDDLVSPSMWRVHDCEARLKKAKALLATPPAATAADEVQSVVREYIEARAGISQAEGAWTPRKVWRITDPEMVRFRAADDKLCALLSQPAREDKEVSELVQSAKSLIHWVRQLHQFGIPMQRALDDTCKAVDAITQRAATKPHGEALEENEIRGACIHSVDLTRSCGECGRTTLPEVSAVPVYEGPCMCARDYCLNRMGDTPHPTWKCRKDALPSTSAQDEGNER